MTRNEVRLCGIILFERQRAESLCVGMSVLCLVGMAWVSATLGCQDAIDGYGWHDIVWLPVTLSTYVNARNFFRSQRSLSSIRRASRVLEHCLTSHGEFREEDLEAAVLAALPGVDFEYIDHDDDE